MRIKKLISGFFRLSILVLLHLHATHLYTAATTQRAQMPQLRLIPVSYDTTAYEFSVLVYASNQQQEWHSFSMVLPPELSYGQKKGFESLWAIGDERERRAIFAQITAALHKQLTQGGRPYNKFTTDTAWQQKQPFSSLFYSNDNVSASQQDPYMFVEIPFERGSNLISRGHDFAWLKYGDIHGKDTIGVAQLPMNQQLRTFLEAYLPLLNLGGSTIFGPSTQAASFMKNHDLIPEEGSQIISRGPQALEEIRTDAFKAMQTTRELLPAAAASSSAAAPAPFVVQKLAPPTVPPPPPPTAPPAIKPLTPPTVPPPPSPLLEIVKMSLGAPERMGFQKKLRSNFMIDIMSRDINTYTPPELLAKVVSYSPATGISFVHPNSGAMFAAGIFEQLNLEKLRAQTNSANKRGGSLSVVAYAPGENILASEEGSYVHPATARALLDTGALQANPYNSKKTLFGVASNFNGLEGAEYGDDGLLLTTYASDHTQGPYAVISAAAGIILRAFYAYYNAKTKPYEWRQGQNARPQEKQENFLAGLGIIVRNGYPTEPQDVLVSKILGKNGSAFNIGYHHNIQVTNGFMIDPEYHESFYDPEQRIDQAFAAALPLNYDLAFGSQLNREDEKVQQAAQLILDWTYEAILRAAYINGITKIILPIIGGGAFNNNPLWVAQALNKLIPLIRQLGITVILNAYNMEQNPKFAREMPATTGMLQRVVKQTGGVYLHIHADGSIEQVATP